MDPEPSTQPLQYHVNREYNTFCFWVFFLIFCLFFTWFLYLDINPEPRIQPLQLHMAPLSNIIFHSFFPNFLLVVLHCTGAFLFKVKGSRGVENQ